jgi:hypothetical protein
MLVSLEALPIVTDVRNEQRKNALSKIAVTESGIMMDVIADCKNMPPAIAVNLEPLPIVTVVSELQYWKVP